jgi:hypothetical protein
VLQANSSSHYALRTSRHLITNQDDYDAAMPDVGSITRHKWDPTYDKHTIRNILRAQNSLTLVWSLMVQHAFEQGIEYDAVIILRPDVMYLTDIDILLRELPENAVHVPCFQSWGGFNDRFAYGKLKPMRTWANRIRAVTACDVNTSKRMNTEKLLKQHLAAYNVQVVLTNMQFARIRATGALERKDRSMVQAACDSGHTKVCSYLEQAKLIDPKASVT